MRIRLKQGKQKELILLSKRGLTWKELSEKIGVKADYLLGDLRYEKRLLSLNLYEKLCGLANVNFNDFIIERLEDNWGKSLGGKNSLGSTIKLIVKENKVALAELIGAILGDGNINYCKKGGTYQVKIAGHLTLDRDYHLNILRPLIEKMFNVKAKEIKSKKSNARFLYMSSKELVNFFISEGLMSGDKIKNQVSIPKWIKENKELLKGCIRGLIDTDGSIHRMSSRDSHLLRLNFSNHNLRLLLDTKDAFESLNFFVTIDKKQHQILISRQKDIERYIKEIGFSNQKHIQRLRDFKKSPLV